MNYTKIANDIISNIGNKENILRAAHCATRLRIVLKNDNLINKEKLDEIEPIKGYFNNGGQFQIILGTGTVDKVYNEFIKQINLEEISKEDLKIESTKKLNLIQRILKLLADVFVPILPALVASGLLMGINNLLTSSGIFSPTQSLIEIYPEIKDLAAIINTASNAGFIFLPILIGFSAAKIFGGTPILGAVVGSIMIHPELLNGYEYGNAILNKTLPYWNILGLNIAKVGYQGTVLPVVASVFCLSKIERKLHNIIPDMLDNVITPFVSVFTTTILTFTVIGPIMRIIGDGMTNAVLWLFFDLGAIGGLIYGIAYPLLVITGMHHSLVTAETQILANINILGGSPTFVVIACANCAQGAASLAIMYLSKKGDKIRTIASASGISALLGITEPAIFGVNLKLRYPFYAALLGGGIGAAYATFSHVLAVSQGPAGVIGVICIRPDYMFQFLTSILLTFVATFTITIIFSKLKTKNRS